MEENEDIDSSWFYKIPSVKANEDIDHSSFDKIPSVEDIQARKEVVDLLENINNYDTPKPDNLKINSYDTPKPVPGFGPYPMPNEETNGFFGAAAWGTASPWDKSLRTGIAKALSICEKNVKGMNNSRWHTSCRTFVLLENPKTCKPFALLHGNRDIKKRSLKEGIDIGSFKVAGKVSIDELLSKLENTEENFELVDKNGRKRNLMSSGKNPDPNLLPMKRYHLRLLDKSISQPSYREYQAKTNKGRTDIFKNGDHHLWFSGDVNLVNELKTEYEKASENESQPPRELNLAGNSLSEILDDEEDDETDSDSDSEAEYDLDVFLLCSSEIDEAVRNEYLVAIQTSLEQVHMEIFLDIEQFVDLIGQYGSTSRFIHVVGHNAEDQKLLFGSCRKGIFKKIENIRSIGLVWSCCNSKLAALASVQSGMCQFSIAAKSQIQQGVFLQLSGSFYSELVAGFDHRHAFKRSIKSIVNNMESSDEIQNIPLMCYRGNTSTNSVKSSWICNVEKELKEYEKQEYVLAKSLEDEQLSTIGWIIPLVPTVSQKHIIGSSQAIFDNRDAIVVYLPTNGGKTFVAASVMLNVFRHNKPVDKAIVFLVPTLVLLQQQTENIAAFTGLRVGRCFGDHVPSKDWKKLCADFDIVVCTAGSLLHHASFENDICMAVFDECHHVHGNHPYSKVLKRIFESKKMESIIHVMGMSATPGGKLCIQSCRTPDVALLHLKTFLGYFGEGSQLVGPLSRPQVDVQIQLIGCDSIFPPDLDKSLSLKVEKYLAMLQGTRDEIVFPSNEMVSKKLQLDHTIKGELKDELNEALLDYSNATLGSGKGWGLVFGHALTERKVIPTVIAATPIRNLVISLRGYKSLSKGKVIVFLEERDHVMRVVAYLSGIFQDCRIESLLGGETSRSICDKIDQFNSGDVNILVSTEVSKEGLDINGCDRVYIIKNIQSGSDLIQLKGRARASGSQVFLIGTSDVINAMLPLRQRTAESLTKAIYIHLQI